MNFSATCHLCKGKCFNYISSNGNQIVRCGDCHLLFVSPMPSEEDRAAYFKDSYIGDRQRLAVLFGSMRVKALQRDANILQALRPNGGTLLDIGTASGAFLTCFSNNDRWHVEGIEPSTFAAALASQITGIPVRAGFLRDQNFPSEYFDVLTSLDAFYFHPNPNADLAEMARILKSDGLLAIEIPGLHFRFFKNRGLICRLIYRKWENLDAGRHLFYYSRKTLGLFANKFGFEELCTFAVPAPVYGPRYQQILYSIFFKISSLLYYASFKKISIVPKEFIVYRKRAAIS